MTSETQDQRSAWIAEHIAGGVLTCGPYEGQRYELLTELTLPGWWAATISGHLRDVHEKWLPVRGRA